MPFSFKKKEKPVEYDINLDTEYLRDATKTHKMQISEKDCIIYKVPVIARDLCVHLYVPLKKCRKDSLYAPWGCKKLFMAYQRCQLNEFSAIFPNTTFT